MVRRVIALVDDDPVIVSLLDDLFSEEGYCTRAILDGNGAHAIIAYEQPDLVILDLWLEQQDTGWTIYDRLRTDDATACIPVVICSADIGALRERTPSIAAHGDGAIAKPFDIAVLVALVADLLDPAPAARQVV